MDCNSISDSEVILPEVVHNKQKPFKSFVIPFVILLLIIIPLLFVVIKFKPWEYRKKTIPPITEVTSSRSPTNRLKITSEVTMGFGFVGKKTDNLLIYNTDNSKLFKTPMRVTEAREFLGKGSSQPLTSSNLLYTAVIDNNNKLYIISHTNFKTYSVETDRTVEFINSWSGDGKKLIYYTSSENVASLLTNQEEKNGKYVFSPIDTYEGFWLYDVETGKKKELYPLQSILGMDANNIILASAYFDLQPFIFSISEFSADFSQIDWKKFGWDENGKKITRQYNICNYCPLWAYVRTDHDREYEKRHPGETLILDYLVVAKFPETVGKNLTSNGFPGINRLALSPNGKLIAYQNYISSVNNGETYKKGDFTCLGAIDEETSLKTTGYWYEQSTPVLWLDDKRLILKLLKNSTEDLHYLIWNTETQQITNIYESIAEPARPLDF